jgi:hypothetical protein
VKTIGGNRNHPGHKDGSREVSLFNSPRGLAVDSHGTVFVADLSNNAIRAIFRGELVHTIANLGPKSASQRSYGIAIDKNDTIFVTQTASNDIKMLTKDQSSDGTSEVGRWVVSSISVSLGMEDSKRITEHGFGTIALDGNGTVYVAIKHGFVLQISRNGLGKILPLKFESIFGIALRDNELFTSENSLRRIHRVTLSVKWSTANHSSFPNHFRQVLKTLMVLRCSHVPSPLQRLPKEILLHVLSFLSLVDSNHSQSKR